ncbi:MAG: hypothetical protein QXJ38_02710 [Thermofilaceae archaeon]
MAVRLGNSLELARERYMKAGFKVPEKRTVYIVKGKDTSQYSMITGNLYVEDAPTEEELLTTAFHELFHAVQDEYISIIYHAALGKSKWVIESTADYAAYRIGLGKSPRSEFTIQYFQQPFTYTDGYQEYATSHLIDYVMKPENLLNFWLQVCKSPVSVESYANILISYASTLNSKPFREIYYGFTKNMLFNDSSIVRAVDTKDIDIIEKLPLKGNLTRKISLKSFTAKLILLQIEYDSNSTSYRNLDISIQDPNRDIIIGVYTAPTVRRSLSKDSIVLPKYREVGVLKDKSSIEVRVNKEERLILLIVAAPQKFEEKIYEIKVSVRDVVKEYKLAYSYREEIEYSNPPTNLELKVSGSIIGLPENAVIIFYDQGLKKGNIFNEPPMLSISIPDFKNPITIKVSLYIDTNFIKGTKFTQVESRPEIHYKKVTTHELDDPEYFICTSEYESSCTIKLPTSGSPAVLSYDVRLDPPLDSSRMLVFTISWRVRTIFEVTSYDKTDVWEEKGKEMIAILVLFIKQG